MKRFLRSRWFIVGLVVLIGTPVAWLMAGGHRPVDSSLVTRVKRGDFMVTVSSTGELRAPKYVKITGPQNASQAGEYQFKIAWLALEGTVVKEGDHVADLDRATIAQKLTDTDLALQKADALNQQASLDSTLNLSKAREDMKTAALTLEEQQITRDQSQFEAPSVKHQAQLAYEKALRALRQDSLDLKTKTDQAIAKMREVGTDLTRQQNKLKIIQDVMDQYTIKAPAPGMLIYLRDWDGKKKGIGTMISSWDPAVATLPDLSVLESVTYVNEIDVRKLAIGQPATLTLDADPTKKLKGTVTQVANSGEQRPNSDAKVFEVVVNVEKPDTTLRPGMTTGNAVQTFAIKNVLHVPLEAVLTEQGVPFVYRRVGGSITKQEVERGAMNDEEVVIARGLQADDEVLLSPPAEHDKLQIVRLPGSKVPNGDSAVGQKLPATPPKADGQKLPANPPTPKAADQKLPATPPKKG
jgi:RND family efflux transporter MFP subunit